MGELRAALESAGFRGVKTYVQSGNVVVTSKSSPERVAAGVHALIKKRFGFDIAVVVRSADEVGRVVRRNPLAAVAVDPKLYLVTFLSAELPDVVVERLRSAAAPEERLAVHGREIYSWHPAGVGRSALWAKIAAKGLGVVATSRNWATVTTLLAMADESADG